MTRPRWVTLLVALVLVALFTGGCEFLELMLEESDQAQVEETANDWVEAKGLNPVNEDGSVDTDAAAKIAKRAATGSTGDPEEDAALNSDNVVRDVRQAEEWAEAAFRDRDTRYLDQAIALRPNDWAYRLDRGALNMHIHFAPDMEQVEKDFQVADSLLGPGRAERIQFAEKGIRQMLWVKEALAKKPDSGAAVLWKDARQCRAVFGRLALYQDMLADQTGRESDRQMAAQYRADLDQCRDQ